MVTEAEAIRAEHETIKQRVAALALKYGDEYPDLLQNYTLAMLLYLREYVSWPAASRPGALDYYIEAANIGEIVNFTSLHRAITATKKDFQTPEQRKRGLELDAAWAKGLTMDDAEGFD